MPGTGQNELRRKRMWPKWDSDVGDNSHYRHRVKTRAKLGSRDIKRGFRGSQEMVMI